VDPSEKNRQAV